MAQQSAYPFTNFNFSVEIKVKGISEENICEAKFSECDGLELSMEVKTIREGGGNNRAIHLAGPVSYSELTLRRGMTANQNLWDWFNMVVQDPSIRSNATVVILAADGKTVQASFELLRCIPLKLKAPSLNAGEGGIAIEEFQLGYEHLSIKSLENDSVKENTKS